MRFICLGSLVLAIVVTAHTARAANVNDLYVQSGTDPTWQELLDRNAIPIGQSSTAGVQGSTIDVVNSLVEQGANAGNPIISDLRLHTLGNSSVQRHASKQWSRWYQEDGSTQIFRLFQGEENVRNSRPNAARIEAFHPTFEWQAGDGWQKWQATYTIIKPTSSAIFQAKNSDNDWSVAINMNDDGDVIMNRRRGADIVMARDMVGESFDIAVYDNGLDYRVFFNDVYQGEGSWSRPTGTSRFRWGMYMGNSAVDQDAMLFVTGATITANVIPEPSSLALLGLTTLLVSGRRGRRTGR